VIGDAEPRPAATVILARDRAAGGIEVYLARRSARSKFVPDVYVFPGGALDAEDALQRATARLDRLPDAVPPGFAVAAIRELFEEAGVLLARDAAGGAPDPAALAAAREALVSGTSFVQVVEGSGWTLLASALAYYSNWITPPGLSRRYDTRFFVACSPEGQTAAVDAVELHDGHWLDPADALEQSRRGELALIFPTVKHLERLSAFASVDALLRHARERRPFPVTPEWVEGGALRLRPEHAEW
jgi:8-oxo-dGTP pyrophosphatase MutT (NUDIX family)